MFELITTFIVYNLIWNCNKCSTYLKNIKKKLSRSLSQMKFVFAHNLVGKMA